MKSIFYKLKTYSRTRFPGKVPIFSEQRFFKILDSCPAQTRLDIVLEIPFSNEVFFRNKEHMTVASPIFSQNQILYQKWAGNFARRRNLV